MGIDDLLPLKIKTMKKIQMVVNHCGECPFCEHDPHYGMSYTSGYDCKNEDSKSTRIVNDIGSRLPNLENLPIPEWCGLPDVEITSKKDK